MTERDKHVGMTPPACIIQKALQSRCTITRLECHTWSKELPDLPKSWVYAKRSLLELLSQAAASKSGADVADTQPQQ